MITLREIIVSLYGAWRLAWLDPAGIRYISSSFAGARRSFWAAAVAAPMHLVLFALRLKVSPTLEPSLRVLLIEIIAYAAYWTAFPVMAHVAVTAINRLQHYPRLVAAFNWISVIQSAVIVVIAPIVVGDALPDILEIGIQLVIYPALLVYVAFTVRSALDVSWGVGASFALLDLLLSLALQSTVAALEKI
jgi:hypothetical protein